MNHWVDIILVLMILTNLRVLGSSQLPSCIQAVSAQGILLGMLPIWLYPESLDFELILIGLFSIVFKGFVFPWLLHRALREAKVKREVEPYVGYTLSLMFGIASLVAGLAMVARAPLPITTASDLLAPVAISTILVGLFITVSRRKALTQALGYLIFENGIHAFGIGVLRHSPLMVELGILLDIFFAVFVMGITIFHISQTFDSIDTAELEDLRD